MNSQRLFWIACLFEGGMFLLALGLGQLAGQSVLASFHWDWRDFLAGCFSAVPLFLFFVWSLGAAWEPAVEIRLFLEAVVRPMLGSQSVLQLGVISLLAGLGEETLFRGAIQSAMTSPLGWFGALLIASLVFGLAHAVSRSYTIIATLIGLYLGGLFLASRNLLVPCACHALYDVLALVYFLRFVPPPPTK